MTAAAIVSLLIEVSRRSVIVAALVGVLSLVTVPHKLLEAVAAKLPDPGDTYQAAAAAVLAGRMSATYQRRAARRERSRRDARSRRASARR